jgi:hypothetical protein
MPYFTISTLLYVFLNLLFFSVEPLKIKLKLFFPFVGKVNIKNER